MGMTCLVSGKNVERGDRKCRSCSWLCGVTGQPGQVIQGLHQSQMEGHAALYPQSGTTLQDTRQRTGTCHSGRPHGKGWVRKTRNLGVWVVKMLQTLGLRSLLLAEMELSMLSTSQPEATGQIALHDPLCSSQSFACNIWILCQRFLKAVTSYVPPWISSVISGRE